MLLLSRWLAVSTGIVLGLIIWTPSARAFGWCCKSRSVTYYQPAPVVACSPCQSAAVVPVTVTTTRCGLFGLQRRTTVTYGSPVPVTAPVVTPAPTPAPVLSAYPPGTLLPAPPPGAIIIGPR